VSEARKTAAVELKALPTLRPPILARQHAVSAGHYLATLAGMRILDRGGNAIDAGVAAGLVLNVVQSDYTNLGGVAPIVVYVAGTGTVSTIAGIGAWPRAASIEWFTERGYDQLPGGILSSVVPSAVDAWLTALARFGTMSLADVAGDAIELADTGFPVHQFLHDNLNIYSAGMSQWPSSMAIYRKDGVIPSVGDLLVQKELANTLRRLVAAEAAAQGDRADAIMAARNRFYTGDIARHIVEFCRDQGGLLTEQDLADYHVEVGPAASVSYRDYEVYACGPWCQGPTVLQALGILNGFDLRPLGQNAVATLHLVAEALKLAFADRQAYYGDPRHVDVPMAKLLSATYLAKRRGMIDPEHAWDRMPPAGDSVEALAARDLAAAPIDSSAVSRGGPDTSYVSVVDRHGNAFSATPSDGAATTPVVAGLGIVISDRGRQSWLDPMNPASVAPGKRPRLTPSPGLVRRGNSFVMPYGTPGGEIQPQAMTQFLVNLIDFGMDPQEAVEAPRIATFSHPESGTPHACTPGLVRGESRLADAMAGLERLGHKIGAWPPYTPLAGAVCAIAADAERQSLVAAADVRRMSYALGW
jgi:gamma-glutamyltranspeptidase / glutathione hydrolase